MAIVKRKFAPLQPGQFEHRLHKLWPGVYPMHTAEMKVSWHTEGKRVLRALAQQMKLPAGKYSVRSSFGGPAVLGEIILHTPFVYVSINGVPAQGMNQVMFRSCNGLTDYTGGPNNYVNIKMFDYLGRFADRLNMFNHGNVL